MNGLEQQQIKTRMLARVLGPYFLIVPATIAARASYMETLLLSSGQIRCGRGCMAQFS